MTDLCGFGLREGLVTFKFRVLTDRFCYRSSNVSILERQLQLCLNKVQQWATDNGFRLSKRKTVCMQTCQKRSLHLDPHLFLDKSPIPVVEETKDVRGLYLT